MLKAKYSAVITIKSNDKEVSVELSQSLSESARSGLTALEQYIGVRVHNTLNPNDFDIRYSSVYAGEDIANEIKDLLEKENIPNIKVVDKRTRG